MKGSVDLMIDFTDPKMHLVDVEGCSAFVSFTTRQ
jgi:hypothetical protein